MAQRTNQVFDVVFGQRQAERLPQVVRLLSNLTSKRVRITRTSNTIKNQIAKVDLVHMIMAHQPQSSEQQRGMRFLLFERHGLERLQTRQANLFLR